MVGISRAKHRPGGFQKPLLPLFIIFLVLPFTFSQFIQGYVPRIDAAGSLIPQYRRTVNDPLQDVFISQNVVVLEYNCDLMQIICANAAAWFQRQSSQIRFTKSATTNSNRPANNPAYQNFVTGVGFHFGEDVAQLLSFDFDTPSKELRGGRACPSGWRNRFLGGQSCPNNVPFPNLRPDGWSKELQITHHPNDLYDTSGTDMAQAEIEAVYTLVNPNNPAQGYNRPQRSGRYYACEEWPPRT